MYFIVVFFIVLVVVKWKLLWGFFIFGYKIFGVLESIILFCRLMCCWWWVIVGWFLVWVIVWFVKVLIMVDFFMFGMFMIMVWMFLLIFLCCGVSLWYSLRILCIFCGLDVVIVIVFIFFFCLRWVIYSLVNLGFVRLCLFSIFI